MKIYAKPKEQLIMIFIINVIGLIIAFWYSSNILMTIIALTLTQLRINKKYYE